MRTASKKRLMSFGLVVGAFTLLAAFFSSETYFISFVKGHPVDFWESLQWNLIRWIPWCVLLPFIVRLARRLAIEKQNYPRTIPLHMLAGVCFSVLHAVIYGCVYWARCLILKVPFSFDLMKLVVKFLHFDVLTYWIILGIYYFLDYQKKYRERELRTSQLEARLAQTQLQVLRMQLHPHFLFNTLHAISALVHKAPKAAEHMISRLSDLLRLTLENSSSQEVALREELEFLKHYLDIEQTRFGDRLRMKLDIRPDTLDGSVPSLILQPLVENAIRHGIAPRKEGGRVEIRSRRSGEKLMIQVYDDGLGIRGTQESIMKNGFGLSNTVERLKHLYGEEHRFKLRNAEQGGTLVTLEIPFRVYTEQDDKGMQDADDDAGTDR